ncbi:MAG: hypothetical protein SPL13_02350, partial [Clostridia bacterium]|nr:hypothetical protein [Clostridia bacterium]
MRIIPRTAKVKIQFFKNVSIADTIIAMFAFALIVLLAISNLGITRFVLIAVVLILAIGLLIPFEGQRFYMFFVHAIKYVFSTKKYTKETTGSQNSIDNFLPFKNIKDGYIEYADYYAGVLQIDPREFSLLSEYRQNQIIDENFGKIIREIADKSKASIVKIDRKLSFESYIADEKRKEENIYKLFDEGELNKKELDARVKIIHDRIRTYSTLTNETPIKRPFYYLVIYDANKEVIDGILNDAVLTFQNIGMTSHVLDSKELGVFLKYNYTSRFEEKDADIVSPEEFMQWIKPQVIEFKPMTAIVDGEECFTYTVKNLPVSVLNAWGYKIFNIPNTKVV